MNSSDWIMLFLKLFIIFSSSSFSICKWEAIRVIEAVSLFPHGVNAITIAMTDWAAILWLLWRCTEQWRSQGLPGWAPTRRVKMRKKMSKVWGKIRKINRHLRKNDESVTLAHPGLWGWLRPWHRSLYSNVSNWYHFCWKQIFYWQLKNVQKHRSNF